MHMPVTVAVAGASGYAGGEVLASEAYDGLAGVIDYASGDQVATAVLVRDLDGLFRVAFVSGGESETVGTTPPREEADEVAAVSYTHLTLPTTPYV